MLFKWWSPWEVRHLVHKIIKSKTTIILILLSANFLENYLFNNTLKVVNRPNKKFVLVNDFLKFNLKLSEFKEYSIACKWPSYHLQNSNVCYSFVLQKIKPRYQFLILTSFFHCVLHKYSDSVFKPWFYVDALVQSRVKRFVFKWCLKE